MNAKSTNKELLDSLKESVNLYSDLCEKFVKLEGDSIDNNKLINFARFIVYLIDLMGRSGYLSYLSALDITLTKNLGLRLDLHRFSQFQFDTEPDNYFEYFKKTDTEKERIKLIKDISDLREHTANMQKLLDEYPPGMGETRSITVNDYKLEKYFMDYLDAIAQHYESFSLISLYCKILIEVLKEYPSHEDTKKLHEAQKDSVKNLYYGEHGLQNLLDELTIEEPLKQELKEWYKSIYGEESIRELRNLKIHHYGEEIMKYRQGVIYVTYPNGTKKNYKLDEIKAIKNNLQLSVFLGYFIVMQAFNEMLYQGLMKELGMEESEIE